MAEKHHLVSLICLCGLTVVAVISVHGESNEQPISNDDHAAFPWQLLPYNEELTEQVSRYRAKMSMQGDSCSCMTLNTHGVFFGPLDDHLLHRRTREMSKWKSEQLLTEEPLSLCRGMSPLSYVGGGITVEPLKTVRIVGLSLHDTVTGENNYEISLTSSNQLGVILVESPYNSASFSGNGTHNLVIQTISDTTTVNNLLQHLLYKSTIYDIHARDVLEVKFFNYNLNINVEVKRHLRPRIYNIKRNDDITKKVTIITKTFERYNCLETLIESLNVYYPGMTVLVADDSEHPRTIDAPNVKQYIMPFAEGWFAGRNLLLSQLTTKYFVWVDDDYIFTENTKLENFLEKLEDTNTKLDVVGAFFEDEAGNKFIRNRFYKTMELDPGDEDGDCMRRDGTYHRKLEGYPRCMVVDVVTNFFMAKTQSVRAVGFDPAYQRIGHTEFFLDGFGSLRVASCKDVFIIHKRDNAGNKKYVEFRNRQRGGDDKHENIQHTLFKNNLHCFRL
ncbi:beta-1,4 N-acetylgalactosaminyltransferase 1-like [Saccoglossus kowalevskii]|uniref:Beta-1,4 N-acetylgalactosaminyltransferase 1-like n=1 Tax=Saccoglossus kowalevskii TaxID=10224 RepID=A0ABM0H0F0_SACKO|nr:PREDICTED: beta-1,4 N-acetylgalactosaminyltransferase 1-like [Saccoglossus kowalevskii]